MNLTEVPTELIWPDMHYLFLESSGPFSESAPKLWREFHSKHFPVLKADGYPISSVCSLYKLKPEQLYRAGVIVGAAPDTLADGLSYEHVEGGKYACFTLTGSYSNLPQACSRVFTLVNELNFVLRDAFYIENYVTDPTSTPEEASVTQILVPIA